MIVYYIKSSLTYIREGVAALGISLVACHWLYLVVALVVLAVAYVAFMKKYYHLHEEYLASLKK